MAENHEKINCPYAEEFGEYRSDIGNIKIMVAEIKELVQKQNGRVRKLEDWRNILVGAWGLAILIVSIWLKLS